MDERTKVSVVEALENTLREATYIEVDTKYAKGYLRSCVDTLRFFVDVVKYMDYSLEVILDCKSALVGLFGYRKDCLDAFVETKTNIVEEDEDASIADCISAMENIRCGFELMSAYIKLGMMLTSIDEGLIDDTINRIEAMSPRERKDRTEAFASKMEAYMEETETEFFDKYGCTMKQAHTLCEVIGYVPEFLTGEYQIESICMDSISK